MRIAALAAVLAIAASGCTWVHMAPGAQAVRVAEGYESMIVMSMLAREFDERRAGGLELPA